MTGSLRGKEKYCHDSKFLLCRTTQVQIRLLCFSQPPKVVTEGVFANVTSSESM